MRPNDFTPVIYLWENTPGIGLDKECDSKPGLSRYIKRNPGLSFVATIAGCIVGAVLSGHDGRRGYLHHLAVLPSYRKLGIGKDLVQHCLNGLQRNHIPKCNGFLFNANASGRSFWVHNGWNLRKDLSILQKMTNKT